MKNNEKKLIEKIVANTMPNPNVSIDGFENTEQKSAIAVEMDILKDLTIPTEEEIDQTFELIQDRLEEPEMRLAKNQQVKLGYEKALEVLEGKISESDIINIKGTQASAIADMAVDYLKGLRSQKILLGVPLKGVVVKPTIN